MKIAHLLAAPAVLLLLAACSGETGAPEHAADVDRAAMDHSDGMMGDETAKLNEAQMAYKTVNDTMHTAMADIPADADVAFMQGMLAHHRGAVGMSEVALKYAKDAKARDLAARVIAAQKAEIAEMETWLKDRGTL